MRYLMVGKLEPGMCVGQDIYDAEGNLILEKQQILEEGYIDRLNIKGVPGIYVEDELSKDIEIHPVLRPEVKRQALKLIHDLFVREIANPISQETLLSVVRDVIADIRAYGSEMCNVLDMKVYDNYTYFHCVNVAVLSGVLAIENGIPEEELENLITAALLHDVGKRFVESDVLNAKRRLTEEERRLIVQHPKLGYEFLKDHYDFEPEIYDSVLLHHEWYNGEGYPLRRSGDDIPFYARIIKVADVYDALTSRRPYHAPESPVKAVEYITGSSGVEFDPELVEIFNQKIAVYPAGCEVRLSDGRIAVVMKNYEDAIMSPRIKVVTTGEVIDLKEDAEAHDITILELLI